MDQQQRHWGQPTKRRFLWAGGIVIACCGVVLLLVLLGYHYDWTGFGRSKVNEDVRPYRTLWDWLKLLVVPAVLAIGGYLFARSESKRTQESAEQQRALDRDIAIQQAETDREIADQRRQDDALQAYLDQIGQLLLDKESPLLESEEGDEVRTLARARTLAVFPRLDGGRKGTAVQFLYESGLIGKGRHIVDLRGADLNGVQLAKAVLIEAKLEGALLSGADLSNASLSYADLRGADLSSANLRGAILAGADLSRPERIANNPGPWAWTDPPVTNLKGANMSYAVLQGADLGDVDLSGANLKWASVLHPRAEPPYELRALAQELGMSLVRPGSDNLELERMTKSLEGATMPNGQKYEDWLKSRGEDGKNSAPS